MGRNGFKYIKIIIFIMIIVGVPLTVFLRYPDFGHILTNRDALSAFLAENGKQGSAIYIAIVIVTVVIGLPIGQVINFAGGFIFGAALAYVLSIGGTIAGTLVAVLIARHLGREFVVMVFREKNVERFTRMMDTGKAYVVIILIYLIPGFPKDMFTYAAGLAHIRVLPFTLTAAIARSPGMLATLLLAGFIRTGNMYGVFTVIAAVAAFLIFVLIKRKRIFAYIESLHRRFIQH